MSSQTPDLHIVVAMADAGIEAIAREEGSDIRVVNVAAGPQLPLAAARNYGAREVLGEGAEVVIFLDVDCIPSTRLVARYSSVANDREHRDALLCGPVTYLPPSGAGGYDLTTLDDRVDPHPARPAPADNSVCATSDYTLFWSLSFAVTAAAWRRIGGFCEEYVGYGGEDTDFAATAAARGVPMSWVGGAHAFHQHHPVHTPPVQHLDDIVRNARIFHRRWGRWPMGGWLAAFEADGLISRDTDGTPHALGQ